MRDTPRKPPPWRKIAAALRDYFKPERPKATPTPTPVPGPSPEQMARIEQMRKALPDALVQNLNRNVLAEHGPARDEPIRPSAKALATRITLTPEQQKQLAEFNAGIGAALCANLNRNVLAQDEPQKPDVLPATKPERGEFFDYEGMPCSLGMTGVRSSLCWDTDPPRVFDPVSMRRNGAPITWEQFRTLVAAARAKRDANFQAFMARATPQADGDGQLLLPFV